ncbi:hypothetical protein P1059_00103 [Pasteurella multocida subsp. gallicida P1059]|nr:hypothetical protein NT08PM_1248 [Pasteurella multocida subsp. multocida str. 3480]AHE64613.1 hypothetical protein PMCN03_1158 [Pasteurella multocida subsp. multocida str. HB03]EJZ79929.1 hypothetical protein X73_00094 [Pasteurella multocida subsp. gallicida X73]EJZ81003.1 hypothetical protein P1059_00103 [Pasteurella multocida subsp. gallicida P1059]
MSLVLNNPYLQHSRLTRSFQVFLSIFYGKIKKYDLSRKIVI